MRRMKDWIWFGIACGLLTIGVAAAQAAQPSETLLPQETVGFLAVSNVDTLDAHWKQTQLGRLMDSPIMAAFRKDLHREFQEHWSNLRERFGLTLDDLKGVPGGEVAVAMIEPKPGEEAIVFLIDVTGHLAQANVLLTTATASLLKQGAKQSGLKIGGVAVSVFDLPLPSEEQLPQAAAGSAAAPAPAATARQPDQTVYALVGNLLVAADSVEVVRGILGRVADRNGRAWAPAWRELPGYKAVMKRCAATAGRRAAIRSAGSSFPWVMPRPPGPPR